MNHTRWSSVLSGWSLGRRGGSEERGRRRGLRVLAIVAAIGVTAGVAVAPAAAEDDVRIVVKSGKEARPAGPVWCKLPKAAKVPVGAVVAVDAATGEAVPAQASADGEVCLWLPASKPGAERAFVIKGPDRDAKTVVETDTKPDGHADIRFGGKLFTSYVYKGDAVRPYLFPVIGPYGDPITRAYPMKTDVADERKDHPHHRSFWSAWGNVNGVDQWAQGEGPKQGYQRHRAFERAESGPVFGRLVCRIDWVTKEDKRQFTEERTYTFYRPTDAGNLVDVTLTFKFTDGDVTFGDTKEGGFVAFRVAHTIAETTNKGGVIRNAAGGKGSAECWGKAADWCDYYGPVNDHVVGIAILDAPSNVGHPTHWHVRDYGLFAANPFGLKDFEPTKKVDGSKTWKNGESVTFRYRVWIHKGDTDAAHVADEYSLFADPPVAKVP